jgi:hypothetical protein
MWRNMDGHSIADLLAAGWCASASSARLRAHFHAHVLAPAAAPLAAGADLEALGDAVDPATLVGLGAAVSQAYWPPAWTTAFLSFAKPPSPC